MCRLVNFQSVRLLAYDLISTQSSSMPPSFEVEGSSDGSTWELVKRHVLESWELDTKSQRFYVEQNGPGVWYNHFRINSVFGSDVTIMEWRLYSSADLPLRVLPERQCAVSLCESCVCGGGIQQRMLSRLKKS
jgi:hypothetical protein